MPIVAHYIAESKHLFFHSGDFPQWLRLFKKNGRKRPGAGGMCGRRAAASGAWLYGNAVLATTGGHGRAGCTTEHRASEQSALYHKKPLCVRRTSCPAVSECGVSTHSIQTSPRSRSPQPIEACAAGSRGGRARFVPPTPKENRKG